MPVTYSIKRNSLSSKWGVWATESGSRLPVENLMAELKTREHADSYRVRIEAGEQHEAIMASLTGNKPKGTGGRGVFGKLFKRREPGIQTATAATESNPVIEIKATGSRDQQERTSPVESPTESATAAIPVTPSRFQVIEQPPAPSPITEEPVAAKASSDEESSEMNTGESHQIKASVETVIEADGEGPQEQQAEQASVTAEVVDETRETAAESNEVADVRAEEETLEDVQTTESQEQPVTVEPAAERKPEPESGTAKLMNQSATEQDASRENGLLVDWTFTPPPDVTPEQLRASGKKVATNPVTVSSESKVDPEWAGPTKSEPASPLSEGAGTGRITVDICVSKALKDSASGDSRISDKKYNSIASKEYTEVSKAFATGNSPEYLREELTHLAAVCMAWADAIEKRQVDKMGSKAA